MKKFIAIFMSVFLMLLSACTKSENNNEYYNANKTSSNNSHLSSITSTEVSASKNNSLDNNSSKNKTSSPTKTSKLTGQNTSKNSILENSSTYYRDLKCREIPYDLWETVQIENTQSKIKLQLDLPDDWSITKVNKTTLNIMRSGKKIGIITSGKLPSYIEDFYTVCNTVGNTEASMQIARYKENKKDVFYRNFIFSTNLNGTTHKINLHIKYTELDDYAADDIMQNFEVTQPSKTILDPSETNGSKQILILGNSFIRTSEIGSFLNDMLKSTKDEYSAIAVSRGMAHVEDYANDTDICNSIRQGNFSYVFICGFYSSEGTDALYTLKNVCNASNTQLVIFPAHNENIVNVQKAIDEHIDTAVLSWKNEINALIDGGVSYDDFCIDDAHQHSTPLAGYVGAHMIYRSIFKTTPPALSNYAPLTNEYVNTKLKKYIDNGGKVENNIKIYEIN